MSRGVGLAVHLYDSAGRWIAWYRPGMPYVWNTRDRWIGWFPWSHEPSPEPRDDVLDPADRYLGTVIGDRLLARTARRPRPVLAKVPEPQRPVGPPDLDRAMALTPPIGFTDVDARRLLGD